MKLKAEQRVNIILVSQNRGCLRRSLRLAVKHFHTELERREVIGAPEFFVPRKIRKEPLSTPRDHDAFRSRVVGKDVSRLIRRYRDRPFAASSRNMTENVITLSVSARN